MPDGERIKVNTPITPTAPDALSAPPTGIPLHQERNAINSQRASTLSDQPALNAPGDTAAGAHR